MLVIKGLELYENKNEFLKTHLDKYLSDDKNSYIPDSSGTKQIAVSAQGFIAYSVLNTYNALSDGWTQLEGFDSLEAFDELLLILALKNIYEELECYLIK